MNNPCHIDFDINSAYSTQCASKIQRWVSNRDVKRAAKKLKETIANQSYRQSLIRYLSKHLCNDTCEYLLLGSDDSEILASFTPFDRKHVTMKARHVTDALRELVAASISNTPITWLECCEKAIEINFKTIKQASTVADWYLELHKSKESQFCRSKRGKDSHVALSPYAEDELLTVQLKSWARKDIEHMTVKKTQEFINTKLLKDWTAEQFSTYKISFPVSESVTARWIKEAGFKYEQHTKSYYVDRHEDEDVVSDRNTYVTMFLKDEKYEECWVQITRRKYDELRVKHLINEVKVKEENAMRDDIAVKMAAFIADKQVHHYVADGKDMVELHVDAVYGYDEGDTTNKHLPPLRIMGGNRSVRLHHGEKTRLCFGQDEAIFRSSQLNESCWTIDGETTLRTKGLGVGIMVSAMVSRAFGFGMDISKRHYIRNQ